MYYTGIDPRDGKAVAVVRNPHEKAMQRALIQYRNPKNYDLVLQALNQAGRGDLIGTGEKCLIKPPSRVHQPVNPKNAYGKNYHKTTKRDKKR
jgi:hypothetical protein